MPCDVRLPVTGHRVALVCFDFDIRVTDARLKGFYSLNPLSKSDDNERAPMSMNLQLDRRAELN